MDDLYRKRLAEWGATERARDIEDAYHHQITLLTATLELLDQELQDLKAGGQTAEDILRDYLGNACRGLGRMAVVLQLVASMIDRRANIEQWLLQGEEQRFIELNQTIRMRQLRESFSDCAEDFLRRT